MTTPIYLDNQATTRVDPRVMQAMLPFFETDYGNAGSLIHTFGEAARNAVEASRATIARLIHAEADEIVVTSGATESNNLALQGVAMHPRQSRRQILSVTTEHHAVLDPLKRLTQHGFEITLLPVLGTRHADCGRIDLDCLRDALSDQTAIVSVMMANNEIGVIQPLREIASLVHEHGALLHTDATQAVGKLPVDVRELGVDLMSFSAHKMYGPKGVGALFVRGSRPRIRLQPQLVGGGQEAGRRSGTLNVPGLVGMARALELSVDQMEDESTGIRSLRDRLWERLTHTLSGVVLNGPTLVEPTWRLAGNLNVQFKSVDGQALMMAEPSIAVSSGAACTSSNPEPSHVLRAIGLADDAVRSSLRFGVGRFNTVEEIDLVAERIGHAVEHLRQMGSTLS